MALRGQYAQHRVLAGPSFKSRQATALQRAAKEGWFQYALVRLGSLSLLPNSTVTRLGQNTRELLRHLTLYSYAELVEASAFSSYREDLVRGSDRRKSSMDSYLGLLAMFLRRNGVGIELVESQTFANLRFARQAFQVEATKEMLRVGVAVRLYWAEQGKLPSSLDALVPQFLAAVPRDPFNGKPLHYSAKMRVIWSAGSNSYDDDDEAGSLRHIWLRDPSLANSMDVLQMHRAPALDLRFAPPMPDDDGALERAQGNP
jgi:hypothetical protein